MANRSRKKGESIKKFSDLRKLLVFKLFIIFAVLSVLSIIFVQIFNEKVQLSPGDYIGEYNEKIEEIETKIDNSFNVLVGFFIFGAVFFFIVILYIWFFTSSF